MKKFHLFAFIICMLLAAGSVVYIFIAKKDKNGNEDGFVADANQQQSLEIFAPDTFELVLGQTKLLPITTNEPSATITISFDRENVINLTSERNATALSVGNVVCTITAEIYEIKKVKNIAISVVEKSVEFEILNNLTNKFVAGVNNDGKFEIYSLKINTNFSLLETLLSPSENVVITSQSFLNQEKTSVLLLFYLESAGEFSFGLENFVFAKTSSLFVRNLNLEFENQIVLVENVLNLYLLNNNKQTAYDCGIFDNATIKNNLENFEVQIEDSEVVSFEDNTFYARQLGQTEVTLISKDNSFYEVCFTIIVEQVLPQSFVLLLNGAEQTSYTIKENAVLILEVVAILPTYSTNSNYIVETSSNLLFCKNTNEITALFAGEGIIKVILSGNTEAFKIINIIIQTVPQVQERTFNLEFYNGLEKLNMLDNVIKLPSYGSYELQVLARDENNVLINSNKISVYSNQDIFIELESSILTFELVNETILTFTIESYTFLIEVIFCLDED